MKEFVEKLIERLEEKRMEYFLAIANTGDEKLDFVYENIGDLIDSITVIVNILAEEYNQDSTKKNQGWIPVTERLPEEDGRYLTTVKFSSGLIECFDLYLTDGEWLIDEDDDEFCGEVIAWQPLPEPYKPEEKQEETQTNFYAERFNKVL